MAASKWPWTARDRARVYIRRGGLIERPAASLARLVQEAPADPEAQRAPFMRERRHELRGMAEGGGNDIHHVARSVRDRIAAVPRACAGQSRSPRSASSVPPSSGLVRRPSFRPSAASVSSPLLPMKRLDHAPPASTTEEQAISPRSVTTPTPCRPRVADPAPRIL